MATTMWMLSQEKILDQSTYTIFYKNVATMESEWYGFRSISVFIQERKVFFFHFINFYLIANEMLPFETFTLNTEIISVFLNGFKVSEHRITTVNILTNNNWHSLSNIQNFPPNKVSFCLRVVFFSFKRKEWRKKIRKKKVISNFKSIAIDFSLSKHQFLLLPLVRELNLRCFSQKCLKLK